MIHTPPSEIQNREDTEISFYEALARAIQASGLTHAEIARKTNKLLSEALERMLEQIQDPAERILTKMAKQDAYLHRSTIGRAISGEDLVTAETLERIALGAGLDADTLRELEEKRCEETYVHHSTQQRAIVTKTDKGKQLDELPRCLMEL